MISVIIFFNYQVLSQSSGHFTNPRGHVLVTDSLYEWQQKGLVGCCDKLQDIFGSISPIITEVKWLDD